jgi:hypothetical protein
VRRPLLVSCLALLVFCATSDAAGASATRPGNAIFPFGPSTYPTSMAAARAFGVLIGFSRRDPYVASGDVVTVVANAPFYESAMHLEDSGGEWYVSSVVTPTIDVTSPAADADVGPTVHVRLLALDALQYLATVQVNDSTFTPGTQLKKSTSHYDGPTTAIGPDSEVGIYAGGIPFARRKDQWGYVLVLTVTPDGAVWAARTVRIAD